MTAYTATLPTTPSTPNAAPQAAAARTTPAASVMTTVSSMGQLHAEAPEVEHAMMVSIAFNITTDMKHHQDRIKEIQREADRNAKG